MFHSIAGPDPAWTRPGDGKVPLLTYDLEAIPVPNLRLAWIEQTDCHSRSGSLFFEISQLHARRAEECRRVYTESYTGYTDG